MNGSRFITDSTTITSGLHVLHCRALAVTVSWTGHIFIYSDKSCAWHEVYTKQVTEEIIFLQSAKLLAFWLFCAIGPQKWTGRESDGLINCFPLCWLFVLLEIALSNLLVQMLMSDIIMMIGVWCLDNSSMKSQLNCDYFILLWEQKSLGSDLIHRINSMIL